MKATMIAALLLAALAGPVSARPVLYECRFPQGTGRGWISSQVQVRHEPDSATAQVADGIILATAKKPISADVSVLTDGSMVVTWYLNGLKDTTNTDIPNFKYRLTIKNSSGTGYIKAEPMGFKNNFQARGTCK